MPGQELAITRRRLPHWRLGGAWYFVTFSIKAESLDLDEISLIRQHIIDRAKLAYSLSAVCVMPDHVHIILSPRQGIALSRILQGLKGASARLINLRRGKRGRFWQVESWDRIIRDGAEFHEKLNYMLMNPVKAGLIENPREWCGWYLGSDAD
jgi:REP element-mobilizing transposase RayT